MPFYFKQGKTPKKRHTVFNNPKGNKYYEELVILSQYINGLQHLFEGMEDGPMNTVEPIELVRLLEPVIVPRSPTWPPLSA